MTDTNTGNTKESPHYILHCTCHSSKVGIVCVARYVETGNQERIATVRFVHCVKKAQLASQESRVNYLHLCEKARLRNSGICIVFKRMYNSSSNTMT